MPGAGEVGRQPGKLGGVIERLLGNRLLLERPQEIEISHGDEEKRVVMLAGSGILPCGHLLVGNTGLENGVGDGELCGKARDGRRPAAYGVHAHSGLQRGAADDGNSAVGVLQWPVVVLIVDSGLNGREPEDLRPAELRKGLVDLFVGEGDPRVAAGGHRQGGREADDVAVFDRCLAALRRRKAGRERRCEGRSVRALRTVAKRRDGGGRRRCGD